MKNSYKTNRILFSAILLCFITFTSCSKSDDNNPEPTPDNSELILGKWSIFLDGYFQENGKSREFIQRMTTSPVVFEFSKDGKMKIGEEDNYYTVSGNQLIVGGQECTITKLDKNNLVFDLITGENVDYEGRIGTVYFVYSGTRISE